MCLSQLEILAKRNLRNFSYSTWHWACLATSIWVICPPKGKPETAWHLYRGDFLDQEQLPVYGGKSWQSQLSQPLLQRSRTVHSLQQKGHYLALLFSLGKQRDQDTRYFPPLHQYIGLHKSGHSDPNPRGLARNVNRKCLAAWSISLGCFSQPPLETWWGLSAARGEGGPWCGASGHFLKNSEIHLSFFAKERYKVGEEAGINRDRWGKASQTRDQWSGDWQ